MQQVGNDDAEMSIESEGLAAILNVSTFHPLLGEGDGVDVDDAAFPTRCLTAAACSLTRVKFSPKSSRSAPARPLTRRTCMRRRSPKLPIG